MASERYELGLGFLREHRDPASVEATVRGLDERSPRFAEYSVSASYGEVYQRDGLSLQQRQLVTLAILATLGGTTDQIKVHTELALNLGLQPVEIVEAMIQVHEYAGAPRASSAMRPISEAFKAAGVTAP